jgi:hypothetical protein
LSTHLSLDQINDATFTAHLSWIYQDLMCQTVILRISHDMLSLCLEVSLWMFYF